MADAAWRRPGGRGGDGGRGCGVARPGGVPARTPQPMEDPWLNREVLYISTTVFPAMHSPLTVAMFNRSLGEMAGTWGVTPGQAAARFRRLPFVLFAVSSSPW